MWARTSIRSGHKGRPPNVYQSLRQVGWVAGARGGVEPSHPVEKEREGHGTQFEAQCRFRVSKMTLNHRGGGALIGVRTQYVLRGEQRDISGNDYKDVPGICGGDCQVFDR